MESVLLRNNRLRKKLYEVYFLEPNQIGSDWLTSLYKKITAPLKSMPFFVILPLSGLVALGTYVLLGQIAIMLVSVLQYGF